MENDDKIENNDSSADSKPSSTLEQFIQEFIDRRESGDITGFDDFALEHPDVEIEMKQLFERLKAEGLIPSAFFFGRHSVPAAIDPGFRLHEGQVISEYRLVKPIGQGGMGQVWEAEQVSLQRRVALKVIKPEKVNERTLRLFAREARAGGRLSHPGIVTVYDQGEEEGIHWITMELIEGNWTLKNFIEQMSRLPQLPGDYYRQVALFIKKTGEALQAAHNAGVIHRDLKPQNILIAPNDQPKLTDFGLAKITDETAISHTGEFAGTYFYMSPEQITAGRIRIDHRTDIFSLGMILYELLALRRPFEGDTSHQVADQIVNYDPPDLRKLRSLIPGEIAVICNKAMEKGRERRYQSMAEFATDISSFLNNEPIVAQPPKPWRKSMKWIYRNLVVSVAVGVAFVFLLGFLGFVLLWSNPKIRHEKNLANDRYKEIIRLADVKRISDLEAEEKTLWPAYPEKIIALEDWLGRSRDLAGRLAIHEKTLMDLKAIALPFDRSIALNDRDGQLATADRQTLEVEVSKHRAWVFDSTASQWQQDTLLELITRIKALVNEENGLQKKVQKRLEFAATIEKRSIEDFQSAWEIAIDSIADTTKCAEYNGLTIEPIIGLVPIGRDAKSGLWEFAHLQTGDIPERDSEGNLVWNEEMGLVFVLVPGGTLTMGAVTPSDDQPKGTDNSDPAAQPDESPLHDVEIAPFLMSKYEFTQGQWLRITGENPSLYDPDEELGEKKATLLHPVENVSWNVCNEMAQNLDLRMPSEAEWEYAARALATTVFWTGNDELSLLGAANLADSCCKKFAADPMMTFVEWDDGFAGHAPTGSFRPNRFGLHDVAGNVCEWCQDTWHETYSNAPKTGIAWVDDKSELRVIRGGSWSRTASSCRSAYRAWDDPEMHDYDLGLRLALSLPSH